MNAPTPLLASQIVAQVCLFLFAAIALFGGTLQYVRGQPQTEPRLDNVHRFMAGIYLGCGLISLWVALTIRQQGVLVFLIALSVFIAGTGRLVSMRKVGLPKPPALWLGYLVPELAVSWVLAIAHYLTMRATGAGL